MNNEKGQLAVPPGFRFHPTDEELLYYYLRKKVAYEAIDLDVIREVDLNKLEPWDLNDKCRIGTGPQNEWYFFSHKDKKYPTGTRTNRATTAGFWKATGRDKAIHVSHSKRIGMRKTLVFYTGRAPHGLKTDWIMHEYRLDTHHTPDDQLQQEEGWVVCRVFKKKNLQKCIIPSETLNHLHPHHNIFMRPSPSTTTSFPQPPIHSYINIAHPPFDFSFDNQAAINMHLPQLLSPDAPSAAPFFPQSSINPVDLECSHNLMKLTSIGGSGAGGFSAEKMAGDWCTLDKLIGSGQQIIQPDPFCQAKWCGNVSTSTPLQYLGCEADLLKFCKEG